MSLIVPENEKDAYLCAIRLHMEQHFGTELKSVHIPEIKLRFSETDVYTVEIFRFMQHFPIPLPIHVPHVDLFIDPITKNPKLVVFGEKQFVSDLEIPIPPERLEHFFASIIWGAEISKKGVLVKQKPLIVQ